MSAANQFITKAITRRQKFHRRLGFVIFAQKAIKSNVKMKLCDNLRCFAEFCTTSGKSQKKFLQACKNLFGKTAVDIWSRYLHFGPFRAILGHFPKRGAVEFFTKAHSHWHTQAKARTRGLWHIKAQNNPKRHKMAQKRMQNPKII